MRVETELAIAKSNDIGSIEDQGYEVNGKDLRILKQNQ